MGDVGGMAGFLPDIPKHLFEGIDIWAITVGSASVTFDLEGGKRIMLQPYGLTEDRGDWLYNLPLCGDESVQSLCGQTIESITFLEVHHARFQFSGGRVLDLVNDNPPAWEIANFIVGEDEYLA